MRIFGIFKIFNLWMAAVICLCMAMQKTYAAPCPCDIYKTGGTPCVAAHSTVRALFESYKGPLYQVKRTSDNATKDIGVTPDGYANIATQDSFLNGKAGTISKIYDQTENHNDLVKSPKAYWLANGGNEANANDGKHNVNGHVVHGIYVTGTYDASSSTKNVAYRNNACKGTAKNDEPEAMYMVVDGKRSSSSCCFDYGNAETTGNDDGNGTMEALYWGKDVGWGGYGVGSGPWVAADLENGMFKGNAGGYQYGDTHKTPWSTAQSVIANYATCMLKGPSGNSFILKAGNAQSGKLTTMWNGARPSPGYVPMKKKGAIILGTGGDGSNGGTGTFFEGAMTSGVPTDAVDEAIQANIIAAGYGSTTTAVTSFSTNHTKTVSTFKAAYNPITASAVISYSLLDAHRVSAAIFDPQGKQITTIENGIQSAGQHEMVWDAKQVPTGIYVVKMMTDGYSGWAGKIIIGK